MTTSPTRSDQARSEGVPVSTHLLSGPDRRGSAHVPEACTAFTSPALQNKWEWPEP